METFYDFKVSNLYYILQTIIFLDEPQISASAKHWKTVK